MSTTYRFWIPALASVMILALAGCGKHSHDDGHDHARSHGHSHGDDAVSFSGATHKEGEGITLLEQTRKALGIQVAEVEARKLSLETRLMARVFAAPRQSATSMTNSLLPTLLASGTLPVSEAKLLRPGLPVTLKTESNADIRGSVRSVESGVTADEAEVIIEFTAPETSAPVGSFVKAQVSVPREDATMAVPRDALVRGADANFVYVVNVDAYLRTCVQAGAESEGFVEIREGLLPGDSVVTHGALQLWLIELRAVKGGQGCCPAPTARKKK